MHADAPFWQHPGYTLFLPGVHAVYDPTVQDVSDLNGYTSKKDTDPLRMATHKRVPLRSETHKWANNPFARNRNPSVVHLCEQPPIYRGSSFWCAPFLLALSGWQVGAPWLFLNLV